MKTFKEYVQRGYSIGPVSTIKPMASLGDVPPKNKGHRNRRAMGLVSSVLRGKAKEHIPSLKEKDGANTPPKKYGMWRRWTQSHGRNN